MILWHRLMRDDYNYEMMHYRICQLPKVFHVSHETITNSQNFQYAVNSHAIEFHAAVVSCEGKLGNLGIRSSVWPTCSLQCLIQCHG